MAGGDGLSIAKQVYVKAFSRFDELCGPYATVIDIDKNKLRPWLQDFDLKGVAYTPEMVGAQIQATKDAMGAAYTGYYLWDPANTYTWEALTRQENKVE